MVTQKSGGGVDITMVTQKSGGGVDITTSSPLPDSRTCTYRGHNVRGPRIDAAVADDWCWGAEADGEAIAGDGRCLTQGAAEY